MKNFPTVKRIFASGLSVLMGVTLLTVQSCTEKSAETTNELAQKNSDTLNKNSNVVQTPRNIIYLTFDDGPNRGTKNLLRIVDKRKIPITAFVIARHVYNSVDQRQDFEALKRDTLIELANHSYTHANNKYKAFYRNPEKVTADFTRAADSLRFSNKYARTPGRNIWRTVNISGTDDIKSNHAADALAKSGFKLIGWDVEWRHNSKMGLEGTSSQMFEKITNIFKNDKEKTPRHLVFLTHDQFLYDEKSLNELDQLIEMLQQDGNYEFRKISQYPRINEILQ